MHDYGLILTLTGGLTAALIFGSLTQKLRLSPIVGYLLGGVLIGPHTPGFVADLKLAEQLAEIGVILLMFGVGLQFHIRELLAVRRVAVPGAIAQSAVATALGRRLGGMIGWSVRQASSSAGAGGGEHGRPGARSGRQSRRCTRRPGTSPSAGWWWRTCSWSWRWSWCRRSCSPARARPASRPPWALPC
jgi:hypothetical protein